MPFRSVLSELSLRTRTILFVVGLAAVYLLFISGLSTNPPGFYVDESCLAYNGYLLATTGAGETGVTLPLYFQCYTEGYAQFANPTHVYLLGLLYLIVPPSNISARILAATMVFLATLLLGLLAKRISGRWSVGIIVSMTAMLTPWLFEVSRLVLETFFYPLAIVLFLFCLYNASSRERWRNTDSVLIAFTLALITYSYTIGRLLGPMLAFGLIIFSINRRLFRDVLKTWILYFLSLIPLFVVYFTNPNAIIRRFSEVSYMAPDRSWFSILVEFTKNYVQDFSPVFLIVEGDKLLRHHVPGMGEIFVVTFVLVLAGIVLFIIRDWRDPWWRFVIYGTLASVVPGALTVSRHHALRLVALPIFLSVLTVPALSWLAGDEARVPGARDDSNARSGSLRSESLASKLTSPFARRVMLTAVLLFTFVQAAFFQMQFHAIGPERIHDFDGTYHRVLAEAMQEESRPIYLEDGYWGPAYVHAYWYAAVDGIDRSNFVHLRTGEVPPPGSLVLSSNIECQNCQKILQDGACLIYRTRGPRPPASSQSVASGPVPNFGDAVVLKSGEDASGGFAQPRGIAVDRDGAIFVADTGNGRIAKFDPAGKLVSSFGSKGTGDGQLMEPNGIAVDADGSIYVTDSLNFKLVKFDKNGVLLKEWKGTEFGAYGPRDIAIGPNKRIYVVDQGNSRVIIFDPVRETTITFGNMGTGAGQFNNPVGIAIGADLVFVTDPASDRIEVFDLDGNYVREWVVPAWESFLYHYPDIVYDEASKCVFISNGRRNEVLAYDLNGELKKDLNPGSDGTFDNPSALAIAAGKDSRALVVLNTRNGTVTKLPMETKITK